MVNTIARLLAPLSALLLLGQATTAPRVVSIPFQRRASTGSLQKRAGYFTAPLNNYLPLNEYFATVEIGTPPQTLELVIDTGSSDVWFFGTGACDTSTSGGACEGGEYDASSSSTYLLIDAGNFSIQYETAGSGVVGDYIADNLAIGGVTITNLTMAVATQANQTTTGIMGVGLDTDESTVQYTHTYYYNLPDEMYRQGKIGTKSYSLYLDDIDASSGTVIFGGYDTAKFTGELIMLPLQNDSVTGIVDSFAVAWTSLAYTDTNGTFTAIDMGELPAAAILDSGTTLTYLPPNLFAELAYFFGAENSSEIGAYIVSCDIGSYSGSLDYGFGGTDGPVIPVPFGELASPVYNNDGSAALNSNGEQVCIFGLQPNQEGNPILFGQTFLRSAYVMYDLQNFAAGLAPTIFNTEDSNIVEYSASGAQTSITTDTSGPTVTASSAVDNPGNPFTAGSSATLTSGGFGETSGGISFSSGSVAYTRSYPSTSAPASQAASLTALTEGTAAATGNTATGSGSTTTGAAAPLSLPAFSSSVVCVVFGTMVLSISGGMLLM